jgi:hypothetical protein
MSETSDQEVRNETDARDQNEWIERLHNHVGDGARMDAYVCECGDGGCSKPIHLTRAEYEDVRSHATRFAIAVSHENPEIDQLLSEGVRFSVVQKGVGTPARIARESDPRRGPASPEPPLVAPDPALLVTEPPALP